ncbi:MAG: hypothetical protein MJH10_12540, partial [Epibacterium sp.]|nr:hypothetical protein [Epibacterium sp.]
GACVMAGLLTGVESGWVILFLNDDIEWNFKPLSIRRVAARSSNVISVASLLREFAGRAFMGRVLSRQMLVSSP